MKNINVQICHSELANCHSELVLESHGNNKNDVIPNLFRNPMEL